MVLDFMFKLRHRSEEEKNKTLDLLPKHKEQQQGISFSSSEDVHVSTHSLYRFLAVCVKLKSEATRAERLTKLKTDGSTRSSFKQILKDFIFCGENKSCCTSLQIISVTVCEVCYQWKSLDIYSCPPIQFPYQIQEWVWEQALNLENVLHNMT